MHIERERTEFSERSAHDAADARQRVALQLTAGLDLRRVLIAKGVERLTLVKRIRRLIERERQRGLTRHWSYDLNRHIALKEALDRVSAADPDCIQS